MRKSHFKALYALKVVNKTTKNGEAPKFLKFQEFWDFKFLKF